MKYYHNFETVVYTDGTSREVDLGYNIHDLPLNRPIWAVAYSVDDNTERNRLICRPTLGEIHQWSHYNSGTFYPYKKGTNEVRTTGGVNFNSRMYADTYDGAVEMFNELVQKRIDNLLAMVIKAEEDRIVRGDPPQLGVYRGFVGSVEYDSKGNFYYGKLLNTKDSINYSGYDIDDLKKNFKEAVDEYIEFKEGLQNE